MPRTPRNPGTGKRPVNTPASGPGWGGAAKGAGNGSEPVTITRARVVGPLTDEEKALAEEARATYVHFMRDVTNPVYALAAAEKLLDRIEGKAIARTVTPDSAPEWFIEGAPEAEDMDAWQDQARLALAKPAGTAD